ncbi:MULTISPECIES: hypothetical protein [unclassified Haladaptatus]|uniref:hypothetical protein n=1 Tax=unclassified Haladaptatus TaxID=2622732 RepID=UPI00209BEAA2|nr:MULTISPECIES: hypothetical protein [unclassified Haladaptatus]MCO8246413.1 hypothetical protein [Haladaptatus sp. AB643]MCO8254650.1 hypothetical protein [Haladaptatus sp. AB618]
MTTSTLLTGLVAITLASVHLGAGQVRAFRGIPRNYWLSIAGGASVAYVFVHVLPDLKGGTILESVPLLAGFFERHVFLVALGGFALFYGLERLAEESGYENRSIDPKRTTRPGTTMSVFWIHVGAFTTYNALIGYLLVHREQPGIISLLLYATAMALHFIVNDYGFRDHHRDTYDRVGRWVLAAAVVVGWGIGIATHVDEAVVNTLFAFLAGGVILNVIKEELPEERRSRFWAFALGAGGYSAILLWI